MKEQIKIEYVLEPEEARMIKTCLDYCSHRLRKHKECGIHETVDLKDVDKLRKGISYEKTKK